MPSPFIYHYLLDKVRRKVRVTIPTDSRRRSIRPAFATRRYVPDWMRSIRATIPAYRYLLEKLRGNVRVTIPAYPRRRSVRPAVSTYRYVPNWMRSVRATIPAYRYLLEKVRGNVRVTIPAYSRRRSVRPAVSTYRHVPDSMHGVRAAIPAYRYLLDKVRGNVRVTIPAYSRRRSVRPAVSTYRYVPDSMHGVRATIPAYRYVLERTGRSVRLTIPSIYRYVLDKVDRGLRVTLSFPSFRYGIIGIATLAVLAPLCLVLYQSFLTAPLSNSNAQFGLDAYLSVFADAEFSVAFGTTLLLAAGMTLIAVPLGVMLAFLMVRTDVPGRRWLEPLILLPIFLPALVLAFGYVEAFGPAGILAKTFNERVGVVPWNVYSLPFLIAAAGLTHIPYAYLYAAANLRGLGADGEEAARSAGAGTWQVAFGVTLPMMTPAILVAAALVFLLGFELFGLPLVLGDVQGTPVLATYLYKLSNTIGSPPFQLAAVVIAIMVAISFPLLVMQRAIRFAGCGLSLGAKPHRRRPFRLGFWRVPIFAMIALWLAVTVLIPVAALAVRSFAAGWDEGIALSDALTFDHYRELLQYPDAVRSVVNTLAIGLVGGAAAVAFYTAIVLAIHRWPSRWTQAINYLVLAPRAMPELAAGLVLLWVLLFLKPFTPLRETLVSIWLAYTFVWLAYGTRFISSTLLEVDRQLEDVARTVGATEGRMKFDITLPLARNGLLAGWLLIFLLFARDYSTGIYLVGSGNEVIGPLLISLWDSGAIDLVSALAVINVVMIGAGLFIAVRLGVHLHA